MNTQEYIDSGILELYAAGALTPAENAEVDRQAAQYPEVKAALEQHLRAMEAYALIHAKAPRPELEDKIIRKIQALSSSAGEEKPTSGEEAKVLPLAPGHEQEAQDARRWWRVAAVVVLVISAASNVYLFSNLRQTRQELAMSRQAARQYALQVNQLELKTLYTENQLGLLRNPQTLAVRLKGVPQHADAQATVFWNQETREVYFDPASLPAPPSGKQYQLWALANGKPIDAGIVAQSIDSTLQRMKLVEEAQAFAVTLEPEGGSQNPTLTDMYVMGNTSR